MRGRRYEEAKTRRQDSEEARIRARWNMIAAPVKAFSDREFAKGLGLIFDSIVTPLPGLAPIAVMEPPGTEEQRWTAGRKGESDVTRFLSRNLDDRWILLVGYQGARGEIDHVLIGPSGVCAVEVKHYKGLISCSALKWTRRKRAANGYVYPTEEVLQDAGGRSPSRQLNEAADALQSSLDRRFGKGRVRRGIVLSNLAAELDQIHELGIDFLTRLKGWNLDKTLGTQPRISMETVDAIARFLAQDHQLNVYRKNL